VANLFTPLPPDLSEEVFDEILAKGQTRIERIVSNGQHSPPDYWYDQDEHEWVIVLQGQARLILEGTSGEIALKAGDHINIPAHTRHRVAWTTPDESTTWLAVFYRG
jgi:cupin 2 domain-containing protein